MSIPVDEKVNFYYINKDSLEFINLEVFYGYERYTSSINLVYNYKEYCFNKTTFFNKLEFKEALFSGLGHSKLEYNRITDNISLNIDDKIKIELHRDAEYKFPLREYIIDMKKQITELKEVLREIKMILE